MAQADPNLHNNDDATPLIEACENGHTAVAHLLVTAGAARRLSPWHSGSGRAAA